MMSVNSVPWTSSIRRPSNSFGRSNGVDCWLLLVKFPCRSGSPHGVRGAVHLPFALEGAGDNRAVGSADGALCPAATTGASDMTIAEIRAAAVARTPRVI